jgi:hypothetical protein
MHDVLAFKTLVDYRKCFMACVVQRAPPAVLADDPRFGLGTIPTCSKFTTRRAGPSHTARSSKYQELEHLIEYVSDYASTT